MLQRNGISKSMLSQWWT
jgi:ubiquitin C-terminal hydrolase